MTSTSKKGCTTFGVADFLLKINILYTYAYHIKVLVLKLFEPPFSLVCNYRYIYVYIQVQCRNIVQKPF